MDTTVETLKFTFSSEHASSLIFVVKRDVKLQLSELAVPH